MDMKRKSKNSNSKSLGQFLRSRERMVHVSAHARMINNPAKAITESKGAVFIGPEIIPWVQKPGVTFRNAVAA